MPAKQALAEEGTRTKANAPRVPPPPRRGEDEDEREQARGTDAVRSALSEARQALDAAEEALDELEA